MTSTPPTEEQPATDRIAKRFARETAHHQLTVLHNQGLYRHLRFANPQHSEYWFDIITWPGCLTIRGDFGDTFTFSRLPDMLEFFRGKHINPHYWAEKTERGRRGCMTYSEGAFKRVATDLTINAVRYDGAPSGLAGAVRTEIISSSELHDEQTARKLLDNFEFKGFQFSDTWELSFHDYTHTFIWACHALVWGIAQYDAQHQAGTGGPA